MAGKIVADTLEHSTAGSRTTDNIVQGVALVRGNVDGNASTANLHSGSTSMNVSSITDVASGRYTPSFVNNLADKYYQMANHAGYHATSIDQDYGMTFGCYDYASKATGSVPLAGTYTNGSQYEQHQGMFTFFGDLA